MFPKSNFLLLILNCIISILSYNDQGNGSGTLEYNSQMLDDHDLVFIQKHWLMDNQFGIYNQGGRWPLFQLEKCFC